MTNVIVVGPVVLPGQDRPYSSERVNLPILFLAALVNVVVPPGGGPPTGGDTESYGWQKVFSVYLFALKTPSTQQYLTSDE